MIQNPVVEETPTRLPGQCASCGSTQLSSGRTWFLDTDIDYFDTPSYAIQICNICFDVLANKCGYIKIGEEVEQYKKRIAELEAEVQTNERYHRVVRLLGLSPDGINRILNLGEEPNNQDSDDDIDTSPKKRGGKRTPPGEMGGGTEGSAESSDDKDLGGVRSGERSDVSIKL